MENFIVIVNCIISDNSHPVSDCTGLIAGCRLDKSELLSLKSEIELNGLFALYCIFMVIVY